MIGIKIQGRLGNQMFQLAFASVEAKKRDTKFFIIARFHPFLLDYFLLDGYRFKPFNNLLQKVLFRLSNTQPKMLVQTGFENTEDILKQVPSCKLFDGYFQSELFLNGFEKQVREFFKIKPVHKVIFEKKYKDIFLNNKTIAIHVRRTDYLTWERDEKFGSNAALPFSYVERFLEKFDLNAYKIIFISDDIDAVKKHFGQHANFYFESNASIIDFQILTHADILCISNSSFSWWGAYLNEKPGKQVFAPENWLGSKAVGEFPKDIICKDWQRLKVES